MKAVFFGGGERGSLRTLQCDSNFLVVRQRFFTSLELDVAVLALLYRIIIIIIFKSSFFIVRSSVEISEALILTLAVCKR